MVLQISSTYNGQNVSATWSVSKYKISLPQKFHNKSYACRHYRICICWCESKGWYWEPQAPQMPYSNNLDLAVFPSMSKRHTQILSAYSRSIAKSDNIYQAVKQVWDKLPSSVIAQGYVLAYRICKKAITTKGDNSFLSGGDFHLDVRKDFMDTDRGVSPSKKGSDQHQQSNLC